MSETITAAPLSLTQSFTYDAFNRLWTAGETGGTAEWSQSYGYDAFGNRWVSANASGGFSLSSFTPQAQSNFDTLNRLNIQSSAYDGWGTSRRSGATRSAMIRRTG